MIRAGFRVIAFVHDEVIVELPIEGCDHTAAARRVEAIMNRAMERVTDTVRVVQQRAGDELHRGSGDPLRQPGELALRPGTHIELPPAGRAGHAAPASGNR